MKDQPVCDRCGQPLAVHPVLDRVEKGISVFVFTCPHAFHGERCGRSTGIVCRPFRFPRIFYANSFVELERMVVDRYGETARWHLSPRGPAMAGAEHD